MLAERVHFPRPSDGKKMVAFEWTPIRYRNVIAVLKNPFYAGAYVQSLNERDLKRYGLRLQPEPSPSPIVSRMINTPAGPVAVDVPKGIDPGFGYHPGVAA